MTATRIFVSSTCYDLRAVREHLRRELTLLGHSPILSEFPVFPVVPDLDSIENCRKAVRDHADVFVLIVGGRRGSVDAVTSRSIVNCEYLEAKGKGLDCFTFVDKQVWDMLPLFERNPTMDPSPVVDHPGVFEFIRSIKADSRWIFPFVRTEEIIDTLRQQLSVFLRELIKRKQQGRLTIPSEFAAASPKVQAIVLEKPKYWEFLLTCELLDQSLKDAHAQITALKNNLVFRPAEMLEHHHVFPRLTAAFEDLTTMVSVIDPVLQQIQAAWGPPGVPGDAVQIKAECDRFHQILEHLVEWETQIRFLRVPDEFRGLINTLRGSTQELLTEMNRLPGELRQITTASSGEVRPGTYKIQLTINAPKTLDAFTCEAERLQKYLGL